MENRFGDKLREGHQIIVDFSHGNCVLRVITALEIKIAISKRKNPKILEIGCGEGFFTQYVLKYNPHLKLDALDISPEMLKEAKRNLSHYQENINFICEDALKFLKDTRPKYDLIFSSWTAHNFKWSDKIKLFKNIYEKLNKNGKLFLLDKIYSDNAKERKQQMKILVLRYGKYIEKNLAKEISAHSKQDFKKNYRMDEGRTIWVLREIGFKDVRICDREGSEAILIASR